MKNHFNRVFAVAILCGQFLFLAAFTLNNSEKFTTKNATESVEKISPEILSSELPPSIFIYPNMEYGIITVSIPDEKINSNLEYQLINAQDKIVSSAILQEANTIFTIQNLPAGAYRIKVHGDAVTFEKSFLIQ